MSEVKRQKLEKVKHLVVAQEVAIRSSIPENLRSLPLRIDTTGSSDRNLIHVVQYLNAEPPSTYKEAIEMQLAICEIFELPDMLYLFNKMLRGEAPAEMGRIKTARLSCGHTTNMIVWFAVSQSKFVLPINVTNWVVMPGLIFNELPCFKTSLLIDDCKDELADLQTLLDNVSGSMTSSEWREIAEKTKNIHSMLCRMTPEAQS